MKWQGKAKKSVDMACSKPHTPGCISLITQKKRHRGVVVVPYVRRKGEASECSHTSVIHRRKCHPTDSEVDNCGTTRQANVVVVPVGRVDKLGPGPDSPRAHPDADGWEGAGWATDAILEVSVTENAAKEVPDIELAVPGEALSINDAGVRKVIRRTLALPATNNVADAPRVLPEPQANSVLHPNRGINLFCNCTQGGMKMMMEAPLQDVRSRRLAQTDKQV